MKTFPFMLQGAGDYSIKKGGTIKDQEKGGRLKVTSISSVEVDGRLVTIIGRCRHLKEGEGVDHA